MQSFTFMAFSKRYLVLLVKDYINEVLAAFNSPGVDKTTRAIVGLDYTVEIHNTAEDHFISSLTGFSPGSGVQYVSWGS